MRRRWRNVAAGEYETVDGKWLAIKHQNHWWKLYQWGGVGWMPVIGDDNERIKFDSLKGAKGKAEEIDLKQELELRRRRSDRYPD